MSSYVQDYSPFSNATPSLHPFSYNTAGRIERVSEWVSEWVSVCVCVRERERQVYSATETVCKKKKNTFNFVAVKLCIKLF